MKQFKIVSDGEAQGTKVFDGAGREVEGINRVAIEIVPGDLVRVRLEIDAAELEITGFDMEKR